MMIAVRMMLEDKDYVEVLEFYNELVTSYTNLERSSRAFVTREKKFLAELEEDAKDPNQTDWFKKCYKGKHEAYSRDVEVAIRKHAENQRRLKHLLYMKEELETYGSLVAKEGREGKSSRNAKGDAK